MESQQRTGKMCYSCALLNQRENNSELMTSTVEGEMNLEEFVYTGVERTMRKSKKGWRNETYTRNPHQRFYSTPAVRAW